MTKKRYCLALDLKDDPELIDKYKEYHQPGKAWPEITESIRSAGIEDMQIYCLGNRLFMIMETDINFDPDEKAKMDANNPKVQEWELLMSQFQQPLPFAKNGEKWVEMELIYKLEAGVNANQ